MTFKWILLLAIVYSSYALKSYRTRHEAGDYLLPLRSSDDQEAPAATCPHFAHGEMRHSLMPDGGAGGAVAGSRLQFNWLLHSAGSGGDSRYWTGSMVTVAGSAAASVRVVAPLLSPGGVACAPGGAATVAETAAMHGCQVALNAGLFDPASGRCLGNLVSDGATLHDSAGVTNAHFGVTASGELFFGYLTQEQLGMFRQLVGGAIWLVRNGTSYVAESLKAECSATQTTGSLRRFASVASARSAVGQRRNGDLVLVQIAGKTDTAGINLFDLANLLIDMDVYNAVNLDGGGSSTLVVNGTVVSSPSDVCPQSPHLACQRRVTSVLCVGASVGAGCGPCNPAGGACDAAGRRCVCRPPHTGPGCYERCRCLNSAACHPDTGDCLCPPGYRGRLCEGRCERGFYGAGCARVCVCAGGDSAGCHHVNGTCAEGGGGGDGGDGGWTANGAYNIVMLVKRRIASVNWTVAVLPAVLAASCLLNACLLVRHCRLRRSASRLQTRWRQHRHEMRRLVEEAPSSDESDREAGM